MAFSKCARPIIFLMSKSRSLCISTTGFTTFQADRSPTENCGYFSQSYSGITQPQWSTRWHPFGSFWMNINVFITSGYTTVTWKRIFSTFSDRFREQLERCQWVLKLTSAPKVSVHTVNHLLPVAQKPVLVYGITKGAFVISKNEPIFSSRSVRTLLEADTNSPERQEEGDFRG